MVEKPFFSFALLCEPGGLPVSRLCVHGVIALVRGPWREGRWKDTEL